MRDRPAATGAGHHGPCVVTIGNLDGVHRGHQALLRRCRALAGAEAQVAAVTFEPLPQAFFRPEQPPARLSTVHQKLALLRDAGVDLCWLMRFDHQFATLSAVDFARRVLADTLGASEVVVGGDFRFGHRREGDVERLTALGVELGFGVTVEPPVSGPDGRISSTAIRAALAAGDFAAAEDMLGRPFRMEGHVIAGERLGRDLGYPTANLRIRARPSPLSGIFAVRARVHEGASPGRWLGGVSSIGIRPTVGGREPLLEVHLFDFDGDLYGRRLEVEFVAKLREEARFDTLDALVDQMRADDAAARAILARQEPGSDSNND
ncbi:bifunctional riboflavin kinase/FAD synthetase [Elongatibacter sediminis]|uniref:Riboflavin biosynthesis protein n=1 Tax=Elongatibacter sediminis TaxID=3119006 RepID=A0AAW9RF64_9GAMM